MFLNINSSHAQSSRTSGYYILNDCESEVAYFQIYGNDVTPVKLFNGSVCSGYVNYTPLKFIEGLRLQIEMEMFGYHFVYAIGDCYGDFPFNIGDQCRSYFDFEISPILPIGSVQVFFYLVDTKNYNIVGIKFDAKIENQ